MWMFITMHRTHVHRQIILETDTSTILTIDVRIKRSDTTFPQMFMFIRMNCMKHIVRDIISTILTRDVRIKVQILPFLRCDCSSQSICID